MELITALEATNNFILNQNYLFGVGNITYNFAPHYTKESFSVLLVSPFILAL